MSIVLASKSPRRRQLMTLVVPAFEVDEADIDEGAVAEMAPAALAQALARQKAGAVFARRPGDVVVGCDTVVELDGRAMGKPRSRQQAMEMLGALSGRRHQVHTGVAVYLPQVTAPAAAFCSTTAVDFAPIPEAAIAAYTQTEEPYDKAGGYGIQGWAARYILGVEGCFYNVMGLPVAALWQQLRRLGVVADDG